MMQKQMPVCNEKELWQKFSILTDELNKFLGQNNIDQFLELSKQREQIEKMIMSQSETAYIKSEEGQTLLRRVIFLNKAIHIAGEKWLNGARTNHKASISYESLGQSLSGTRVDGRL